jgi:hypothetical protein
VEGPEALREYGNCGGSGRTFDFTTSEHHLLLSSFDTSNPQTPVLRPFCRLCVLTMELDVNATPLSPLPVLGVSSCQ